MSESDSRYSPYSYTRNNAIRFTDPDGMMPFDQYYGWDGTLLGEDENGINGKVKFVSKQIILVEKEILLCQLLSISS